MNNGKYVSRPGVMVVDGAAAGFITQTLDTCVVECEDLDSICVFLTNPLFGGTATVVIDYSPDGTSWVKAAASKANSDFAASGDAVLAYTLSDTHGMPLIAKQIRARCTAATAGGEYFLVVTGRQTDNFR